MTNRSQPIVSIGVPVYNGEMFLRECLESILKQSYKDWECVVVDNQSTDASYSIAEEFAKRDNRFKIIKTDSFVPLVDNWNNAFINANSNARYFKLLQADDWMYSNFLEECVRLLESDSSIGVVSSYRLAGTKVDCDGLDIYKGNVFRGREVLYSQLTKQVDISGDISTLIFSYKYLKKLDYYPRIFNGKYHIDTELFYDICNIANVGFIYQVLSYTRRHPDSQTSTVVFKYNTLFQLNEAVLNRFKGEDRKLNKLYKKVREAYAFFFLMQKIKNSRAYEWHKKNIERGFNSGEYIRGCLKYNLISKIIVKIANKIKGIIH